MTLDASASSVRLGERHQTLVSARRTDFTLHMHRALSWLKRAQAAEGDDDVAFVCLWIAFNAAYAQELSGYSEKLAFREFVEQVCGLDEAGVLYGLVRNVFPGPIQSLLENRYVFQPFWDALNGGGDDWQEPFERAQVSAKRALGRKDTARVLYAVSAPVHAAQPDDAWRRDVEQVGQPDAGACRAGHLGPRAAGDVGRDDGCTGQLQRQTVLPGGVCMKSWRPGAVAAVRALTFLITSVGCTLLAWPTPTQSQPARSVQKTEMTALKKFRVRVVGTSPDGKSQFVEYKVVQASFVFEAKDLAMGQVMQFNPQARSNGYQLSVTEVKEVR